MEVNDGYIIRHVNVLTQQDGERVLGLQEDGNTFESVYGKQLQHWSQKGQKCMRCLSCRF